MVHATKRLSECWKECPSSNSAEAILADDGEFDAAEEDAKFLADLGVKFPNSK
jgi:hypothetical protein